MQRDQKPPPQTLLMAGIVIAIMGSATLTKAQAPLSARQVSPVLIQQVDPSIAARAKVIENRVSTLPATEIVDTNRAAPPQPAPDAATTARDPSIAAPEPDNTVPSRPIVARLEYVATPAVLDRQVAQALVGQNAIRKVIGNEGAILPFPGVLRQVEQSGEEIQLKAFGLSGKKLIYDAASKMFTGTIWLGVAEIVAGRPPRALVTPVDFEVLDADFAEPSQIRVERTGAPYKLVKLRLAAALDGGTVMVASNLVPEPIKLELPVSPALLVDAGQSAIEGLGLGTSEINVSLVGVAKPQGRVVTLRTSSGYLGASRLRFDENGMASTSIRSDGLGNAVITASSPGMAAVSADVAYQLPLITFLASIAGGLVGGFIRVGTRPPRRKWSAFRLLIVAMLLGLLVFALYAVGVNVLPVKPSVTVGAALVFAVSGLGAFLGPGILKHAA